MNHSIQSSWPAKRAKSTPVKDRCVSLNTNLKMLCRRVFANKSNRGIIFLIFHIFYPFERMKLLLIARTQEQVVGAKVFFLILSSKSRMKKCRTPIFPCRQIRKCWRVAKHLWDTVYMHGKSSGLTRVNSLFRSLIKTGRHPNTAKAGW